MLFWKLMSFQGNHTFLGPQSSSTFVDSGNVFAVTYGSGNVNGTIITDNINVAGLALNAHTFGVATQESVDFSADTVPFDGLMGLAQSVRTANFPCDLLALTNPSTSDALRATDVDPRRVPCCSRPDHRCHHLVQDSPSPGRLERWRDHLRWP